MDLARDSSAWTVDRPSTDRLRDRLWDRLWDRLRDRRWTVSGTVSGTADGPSPGPSLGPPTDCLRGRFRDRRRTVSSPGDHGSGTARRTVSGTVLSLGVAEARGLGTTAASKPDALRWPGRRAAGGVPRKDPLAAARARRLCATLTQANFLPVEFLSSPFSFVIPQERIDATLPTLARLANLSRASTSFAAGDREDRKGAGPGRSNARGGWPQAEDLRGSMDRFDAEANGASRGASHDRPPTRWLWCWAHSKDYALLRAGPRRIGKPGPPKRVASSIKGPFEAQ